VTLPDVHLAGEAVAAYVDDALSPTPRDRAERHLRSCAECRAMVEAQREAKVLLAASFDPELPAGLLGRLRDIPMTADLGGSDIVLAVDGEQFAWARMPARPDQPGNVQLAVGPVPVGAAAVGAAVRSPVVTGVPFPVTAGVPAGGWRPFGAAFARVSAGAAGSRPHLGGRREAAERGGRPESYPSAARPPRRRRSRRVAGALAGLAFGVIASAASTGSPSTALPDQRGVGGSSGPSSQLVVDRGSVPGAPLDAGTLNVRVPTQRRAALLEGGR
jgi:hypothetical protein